MARRTKAQGFALSAIEAEIIQRVNAERRLENQSLALRQIIREWDEMQKLATKPAKAA